MALWQLGLLVAGGISLIVYLVHAAGGSRAAKLTSADDARARYALDYPEDQPDEILVSENGKSALLNIGDNIVGLVYPVGDCFLTRRLEAGDIANVSMVENTLTLHLEDFTWSGGQFHFSEPKSASRALAWLSQTGTNHA